MDRSLADSRIRKMKEIILEEAHDKAKKVREQTASQFNIEKNKILNQQKDKVNQEYKNKLEQYSVQKKIEKSTKQNAIRINKMNARQDVILKIKDDSKDSLKQRVQGDKNHYKGMLKKLIVQGLIKMMEKSILIRCRSEDNDVVSSVLSEAATEFSKLIKDECNVDFKTNVEFDKYNTLPDNVCSLGGVILSAQGGSILCNNTLDARLNLCYGDSIPDIRRALFPDL